MATKPTTVNKIKDSATILNTIRDNETEAYKTAVPTALSVGDTMPNGARATIADVNANRRAIGQAFGDDINLANAFLGDIVNRIGKVWIASRLYSNPWAVFKKGYLEYGEVIEEIWVDMAKPYQYDPVAAQYHVGKRYLPDVKSAFYQVNFEKFYPITVSQKMLMRAFLTAEGVNDLIDSIITQVYTGANYDEFLTLKYLIMRAALNGRLYPVNIPTVSATNARAVTATMVNYAKLLGYMSPTYNYAGVTTYSDIGDLYTILDTELSSIFDVEVLALSFNMSKAELLGRQIGVDSFGTLDTARLAELSNGDKFNFYTPFTDAELAQLATLKGIMIDKDYFMVYDALAEMTEFFNDESLERTYRYHRWAIYGTSPFANGIVFTTATPSITSVTIAPSAASVTKGQSIQLSATVASTGFADKSVVWSVEGDGLTITQEGLLTISADTTLTSCTVTATSMYDSSVSGTVTITIV